MTSKELTIAFAEGNKAVIEQRVHELSHDLSLREDFKGEWDALLIALICL